MERYKRLAMAVLMGCLVSVAGIWMIVGTKAAVSDSIVTSTEVPADDHYIYLPLIAKNYTVQYRWGDWIVTSTETVENVTVFLSGNIIVENGGSLTVRNVRLTMDCSYEGEYGIFAHAGSSLSICGSEIMPSDQENTFVFTVDNAELLFRNNLIRGVGPREGIWISADEAIVEGNTIYHKESAGITLQGGGGSLIKGNLIHSQGVGGSGIQLNSSHGNTITGNYVRNQIGAIDLVSSWNNLVADNEVTLKLNSTGIHVHNGSGNNVIVNNTIAKDPTAEWA